MNVKWDIELKPTQLRNPVLEIDHVDLTGMFEASESELEIVFPTNKQSLKTWGRTSGELNGVEPHWIGVHKQTPLHIDPAYPRYTHHLMIKVDDFSLRGVNKFEAPLVRGTYVVIDTHSPHQLFARAPEARWYLAVSMDNKQHLPKEVVLPKLLDYLNTQPLLTDEILKPNNGGRF